MNIIKSNKPAISKAINDKELNIRVYYVNYRYLNDNKIISVATNEAPVYRYAKNYSIDGNDYSIIMISTDENAKKVEDFFDKLAKKQDIKKIKKDLSSSFTYLDDTYKENK